MYNATPKSVRLFAVLSSAFFLCAAAHTAQAQDKAVSAPSATPAPQAAAGLLPVPDYSSDIMDNAYLTGDWGGERTDLANKGVQFGIQWNQFYQGVAGGGKNPTTEYGANVDYTINLDLMRMGVLPGALIQFRAESRYGDSVNGDAGTILPVNTKALFPIAGKLNQDIGITVTDLNYTQFLSPNFGVTLGKLDTLGGDPNEFASGRGATEFMNANLIFNPALALRLPYSTLGVGIIWMPIPMKDDRGITVSNLFFNTQDASTTTGFGDFDDGTSWNGEADFRYKLGDLPGGINVGGLYSWNQHFNELNSRLVLQPGQGLSLPSKNNTWAVYGSAWQYLTVKDSGKALVPIAGEPTREGIGLFGRLGFADQDTNPAKFAISGGVGGRGMIPSRENDNYGVGLYYDELQTIRLSGLANLRGDTEGIEGFYNFAVTPACRLSFDLQVVTPAQTTERTATVLGVRASVDF